MSIIPFVSNVAFAPEEVRDLEVAYLNACAAVGAAGQSLEFKENIATKIVAIAMSGERDPTRIYLRFLEEGSRV